jgi:hypothetical protein
MKSMFFEEFGDVDHGYTSRMGEPERDAKAHVFKTLGFDDDFGTRDRNSRIQ